ncbi:hypothetical protein A4G26_10940 [Mycobacterium kansasii]|nr:hypothetical protein A4G26_10940 [Mycobacterium kansasii]
MHSSDHLAVESATSRMRLISRDAGSTRLADGALRVRQQRYFDDDLMINWRTKTVQQRMLTSTRT